MGALRQNKADQLQLVNVQDGKRRETRGVKCLIYYSKPMIMFSAIE